MVLKQSRWLNQKERSPTRRGNQDDRNSESEQELAEHKKNAIFSQIEEEDEIKMFWELSENSIFICAETTLRWSEHMEGLWPLLLFSPAYQFAIKDCYWTKNTPEERFSSVSWRKTMLCSGHGSKSHLVNHNWWLNKNI